jgi:hypothetical protein
MLADHAEDLQRRLVAKYLTTRGLILAIENLNLKVLGYRMKRLFIVAFAIISSILSKESITAESVECKSLTYLLIFY